MITGMCMEKEHYQMHGQDSQDLFYWTNINLTNVHGTRETNEETNNLTTRQIIARYVETCVWCSQNAKRSKSGLSKNQSSILPYDNGVSFSLNQMVEIFDSLWKTLVERRTFRCQQQRFVKHQLQ